jgi:hypothetical protein
MAWTCRRHTTSAAGSKAIVGRTMDYRVVLGDAKEDASQDGLTPADFAFFG